MKFIPVDRYLQQTTLQQYVDHYQFDTEIQRKGKEERIRSPFPCDKCRGNQIIIAVDWQKQVFKTHCYHCDVRGSVTLLLYGMKHHRLPASGDKLKGDDFKEIAEDIALVAGQQPDTPSVSRLASETNIESPPPRQRQTAITNRPLARHPEERIRRLESLDADFIIEPSEMSTKAQKYLADRPYMTPETMQRWNVGVLPQNSKSYIRGCLIYCLKNERGQRLGWAGRHLNFEEKIRQWQRSDRNGVAPIKTKFPPNFQKGSFLFGAELHRMNRPGVQEQIMDTGLIVVEGFNDVISLDTKGVVAVGLCGNHIAEGQIEKLARWSRELAGGRITLFLDNNVEGRNGTLQAIERLSDHAHVRTVWTPNSFDGSYRDCEPEQLSADSLLELFRPLSRSGLILDQISETTSD